MGGFWTLFTNFGTASAGFIGIIIIIRGIKLIADTIIHGYALHSVFGWSIHLLGALWDSVTNLLLHLGKPGTNTEQVREPALELQKGNPSAPQQEIQTPLYTELTHAGNIRTYTEANLYPQAQLNNIEEPSSYPIRL